MNRMRVLRLAAAFCAVVVSLSAGSSLWATGGDMGAGTDPLTDGSEAHPWLIEDFADFGVFTNTANAAIYWAAGVHTRLMCDLDLDPVLSGRQIYGQAPIAGDTDTDITYDGTAYAGIFNGNGHVISNLIIEGASYCGLFGCAINAMITNISLANVIIESDGNYIGSMVGSQVDGEINNCNASGSVTSTRVDNFYVGGLVGKTTDCFVSSCYATCNVTGENSVGGLIGETDGSYNIIDCYATGTVVGDGTHSGVGGLIGYNDCYIINCHATGSVTGTKRLGGLVGENLSSIWYSFATGDLTGNDYLGGLVGEGHGAIQYCFATGSVVGNNYLGGIAGSQEYFKIIDSYSTSRIDGNNYLGGLVGFVESGSPIIRCYSRGVIKTSGGGHVGGLIGYSDKSGCINSFWDILTSGQTVSAGGSGRTTSELQQTSNYIAWNIPMETIWILDEGMDYPRLAWEGTLGSPLLAQVFSDYIPGAGTEPDPYRISTPQQLNIIGLFPDEFNNFFVLENDIDMSDYTVTDFSRIGLSDLFPFTGTFDGDGYVIHNLTYATPGVVNYVGLFGYAENAHILDLGLESINIQSGGSRLGGLAGFANRCTIKDCYTTGIITGTGAESEAVGGVLGAQYLGSIRDCMSSCSVSGKIRVGGLIGSGGGYITSSNTIASCYTAGTVSGNEEVGGLVGELGWGYIVNSYATTSVTGNKAVGGLLGKETLLSDIKYCYATGQVQGTGDNNSDIGGLIGCQDSGEVTNCYATGEVSGDSAVGGLVGRQIYGEIIKCYSTGVISTFYGCMAAGGLVGQVTSDDTNGSGVIMNCFWDVQTSGTTVSAGGIGRTTAEMQKSSNYIDWSFVWVLDEDNDYPHLYWEGTPGEKLPSHELSDFVAGTGYSTDPYRISTPDQLNMVGLFPDEWGKYFQLKNDIDMSAYTSTAYNRIGNQLYPFSGTFYGEGHVISNLSFCTTGEIGYVGMFGYLEDATITYLGLENINIESAGKWIGGLSGSMEGGSISYCYVTGNVTGTGIDSKHIGGFIGRTAGVIGKCWSKCSVSGTSEESYAIGGFVGSSNASLNYCFATGIVVGHDFLGGLVGVQSPSGTINKCYTSGSVNGNDYLGGLVGEQYGGISYSYSVGAVVGNPTSTCVGGLIGRKNFFPGQSYSYKCFWDKQTSGQETSCGGTGLTTVEMQTMSTFTDAGWDFVSTDGNPAEWKMREKPYYPILAWQRDVYGDVAFDGVVNLADVALMAGQWMLTSADGGYLERCDLLDDDVIDGGDLSILAEYWLYPEIAGDFNDESGVNLADFVMLSSTWQAVPSDTNYLPACNLDDSGTSEEIIDLADLAIFCEHWLEGAH